MGSIYLADDLRLEGRLCALKEVEHDRSLPAELLKQARDQFLREATVLARLDHPNLPKVSDFFSIGGRDYLVMDYVPGKDLRTLMTEARQNGEFPARAGCARLGQPACRCADVPAQPESTHRPPRYQAQQPEAHPHRAAQAGRFWPGQDPGIGRSDHHHSAGPWDGTIHPSRTVRRRYRAYRCAQRYLCVRRHTLPSADQPRPRRSARALPASRGAAAAAPASIPISACAPSAPSCGR